MQKRGKRQQEGGVEPGKLAMSVGKGILLSFAVSLGLLFLCAAAISMGMAGQGGGGRWAVLCCLAGVAAGSWMSVGGRRQWAIPLSLATGAGAFCVLMGLGMLLFDGPGETSAIWGILCACLCGGGAVGILRRAPARRRRR